MSARSTVTKIDEFMGKASEALAQTQYFESIRLSQRAMQMARETEDFERMSRIVMPLLEARRQVLQLAYDAGMQGAWEVPITEDIHVDPGCYIIRPPMVGADARRLRLAAFTQEVPVSIICIEPLTREKLLPIVTVTSGLTLRTKVRPPKDLESPDLAWFVEATEILGDWGLDLLDPEMDTVKRIDALLLRIDAHPDHEELHQALEQACRDAAKVPSS